MTLTSRSMDWLNQNRHRSYPMKRDEWRKVASPTSGLDCVLLDAQVFNADSTGDETLEMVSVSVVPGSDSSSGSDSGSSSGSGNDEAEHTEVAMRYDGNLFVVKLYGGETSGEASFDVKRGSVHGAGIRGASLSLVFSSHAYIKDILGYGTWNAECPVLESRVINLTDGVGVDCVTVNGSAGVKDHDLSVSDSKVVGEALGDVVLEDGYRTSPIVNYGRVLVRVGKRYGYDPCNYDFGEEGSVDCRIPLFYFCGQNAINSGNIVLKGGKGISIMQGREYVVDDENSKCNGMSIPCVEIVAGRELLDICDPSAGD